jgi:hypothetical protein
VQEETVKRIINLVAAGNSNVRTVLEVVHQVGKEQIARYPDTKTGNKMVAERMVEATSRLAHTRIDFKQLMELGPKYWETEIGRQNCVKVGQYVEVMIARVKARDAGQTGIGERQSVALTRRQAGAR